jgi:hypothetical protein
LHLFRCHFYTFFSVFYKKYSDFLQVVFQCKKYSGKRDTWKNCNWIYLQCGQRKPKICQRSLWTIPRVIQIIPKSPIFFSKCMWNMYTHWKCNIIKKANSCKRNMYNVNSNVIMDKVLRFWTYFFHSYWAVHKLMTKGSTEARHELLKVKKQLNWLNSLIKVLRFTNEVHYGNRGCGVFKGGVQN